MSAPTLAELRARLVAAKSELAEARRDSVIRLSAARAAYDDARDALLLALADALATGVDRDRSEKCSACGQSADGQTGEYACPQCGIPRLHDDPGPAAAPPEPKPYPVLRHNAGWCIYSDGSDDHFENPMPPGHSSEVLACLTANAGERCFLGRGVVDPGGNFIALVDWPPRAAGPVGKPIIFDNGRRAPECPACGRWHVPGAYKCRHCGADTLRKQADAWLRAVSVWGAMAAAQDKGVVDALKPVARPEPDVPEAVRPWLAALREVWPEVTAKRDGDAFVDVRLPGYSHPVTGWICTVRWNGSAALVPADWGGTYLTPADLIAALRPHLPGGRS